MAEDSAQQEPTSTGDRLRILLGIPLFLVVLALGLFFWLGVPGGLAEALDQAPPWYAALALGALLLDGLVLTVAVRRVSRHRLEPAAFLARIEPAVRDGGIDTALRLCLETGPRGVARLLAAWLQTLDGTPEDRRQAVAEATLEAARALERDARSARWIASLGALLGVGVAIGGMLWSVLGEPLLDRSALPLLVTMVGLVLLLPALSCLCFVAASVSRSANELTAALPVIAGIDLEPPSETGTDSG